MSANTDQATQPKRRGRVKRAILWSLLGFTIVLVLLGITLTQYAVRRAFPQTSGTIEVEGITGTVEVVRDGLGIPHIYADTAEDLLFAQGYVHAQDRFWQMDFWRHISYGELASMFGESEIDTDVFLRDMGWGRLAEAQYAAETPQHQAYLDAYAAGVNAYLASQSPSDLSFEYSILELVNHAYEPEPWTGAQSLAWGKVMAWDLGGNKSNEIERAMLLAQYSPDRVAQLFPSYPGDRNPFIVASAPVDDTPKAVAASIPRTALVPLASAQHAINALDAIGVGGEGTGIGSNSWAISGDHTPTGLPYLMNDPHLGSQMPSIWYQVGLHCRIVNDTCPFEVAGFSFAGVPGVIIGHNADIAWGFTNTGPDVQDLFIEKLNPANPNQYDVNGEWVDMEIRTEIIEVAGGDPVTTSVRTTRHGPIISDSFGELEEFDTAGVELPDTYAIAMQWTALEESPSLAGPIFALNTAKNFEDFQSAARLFEAPAQNLLYADTQGNIGYQMPGRIPIRAAGDGTVPVPGWNDDHEWVGYVPRSELPSSYNPESGWIVTANNAVIDDAYPYLISEDFDYGYRARRIVDLLTSNAEIGLDGHAAIQFDSYDLNAEHVLPYLENALVVVPGITVTDQDQAAINRLFTWDLQNFSGSTGAAIWNATWSNLLRLTFQDEFPEDYWPEGNSRYFEVFRQLLDRPDDAFWDDVTTSALENRDTILALSFLAAVDELSDTISPNVGEWSWGDMHTITFTNQSLGESGIKLIEDRLNRGPYRVSGSKGVINAVGWTATEGYVVDWIPSMRMLVDLSDLTRSRTIHSTGQSGHTDHPHYDDMIPLWMNGQTAPMLWARQDIVDNAEAVLLLVPSS